VAATPAAIILADSPLLYWPLNDERSGDAITAQEVIQSPGVYDMQTIGAGATGTDSTINPVWGSLHTRCLGVNFAGNSTQNPALAYPHSGLGFISKKPWSTSGSSIDPLLASVTTWAVEGWMATPVTTDLNYDFNSNGFGGDLTSNTCWYPYHGEGHPNDNRPPTGFGLNMGTNGFQLLGHHGAYLRGDSGAIVLSDKFEHHIVVNCVDNGNSTQDFFVYVDGVLVMSDTTWGHDPNLYPILPPVGVGIGPYMTYFGSVRHFAVYPHILSSTQIAAHFAHITCQLAHPPVLAGQQVSSDARYDEEFVGRAVLTGVLSPISGGGTTGVSEIIVPWNATGWKYQQFNTDTSDYSGVSFDDSAWAVGQAPMGSDGGQASAGVAPGHGYDSLGGYNTPWHTDTRMWLRRVLGPLPIGTGAVTVNFRADNWGSLYWNGNHFYGDSAFSGGFTLFTVSVPPTLLDNVNLLAVRATDDGFPSASHPPAADGDKAVIDVEVVADVTAVDCGVVGDDNTDWIALDQVTVGWRDSFRNAWHYATVAQARYDVGVAEALSYEWTVYQAGGSLGKWSCGESSFNYFGTNGIILEMAGSPALNLYHRGSVVQSVGAFTPAVGDVVKIVTDFVARTSQLFRNGGLQATLNFAAQTWYTQDGSLL